MRIAPAAGCDGCVDGKGKVRKNATTGDNVGNREDGNEVIMNSEPGAGVVPDDPSATTFV